MEPRPDNSLSPSDFVRFDRGLLAVALILGAITIASLANPKALILADNMQLNVSITTAALIVALGAAYFALTEFVFDGLLTSLFVGLAFVLLANSSASIGLLPILARWRDTLGAAEGGAAMQWSAASALLIVAGLLHDRRLHRSVRVGGVIRGVLVAASAAAAITILVYAAGPTQPPVWMNRTLQLLAAALSFAASAVFWRAGRSSGRTWFIWLSMNLCFGGFAQLMYAARPYEPTFVQVGDILRLMFFVGILLALIAEWGRGYRILRAQTRELSMLHALMAAPSIREPAAVVEHAADIVGRALRAEARVMLGEHPGTGTSYPLPADPLPVGRPDGTSLKTGAAAEHALTIPLRAGDRRLGNLVVMRRADDPFSRYDERLLATFAAQTSVLLERSLLYEEIAAGAILEERSRLAREIHDGLAQHLAFLKMRVAWLQRSSAAVDNDQLQDIEGVLATALAEARQAITTLRADTEATSTGDGIVSYAEEFGQISGLAVRVVCDSDLPEVSPRARVELMRIVQESLNNVRKHAGASLVEVRLLSGKNTLDVQVCDNGSGFSTADAQSGHFGVEIMQERARSIGASIDVVSEPGHGTEIKISVPVTAEP